MWYASHRYNYYAIDEYQEGKQRQAPIQTHLTKREAEEIAWKHNSSIDTTLRQLGYTYSHTENKGQYLAYDVYQKDSQPCQPNTPG